MKKWEMNKTIIEVVLPLPTTLVVLPEPCLTIIDFNLISRDDIEKVSNVNKLNLKKEFVMVRYRSCSVMRCEDKFSSRHRFSDAANNLEPFPKVGVNEALINIPTEQIFHKPSSTLTTGNVGVNIVKVIQ
ncbi:hypothetical protein NQ317_018695 [Molorchus minor]|uniref:Uncharacterized protein n=1 Tax=Molorchus minor TaxID=1323400 RepID=A0ABQ9JQL6_9CUCU|nr:hypothetical protein NQ317_018695 [Molorchus minor]